MEYFKRLLNFTTETQMSPNLNGDGDAMDSDIDTNLNYNDDIRDKNINKNSHIIDINTCVITSDSSDANSVNNDQEILENIEEINNDSNDINETQNNALETEVLDIAQENTTENVNDLDNNCADKESVDNRDLVSYQTIERYSNGTSKCVEETTNKEDLSQILDNNATDEGEVNSSSKDILEQFIDNNIEDFVKTTRNISEILGNLGEVEITPQNSFVDEKTPNLSLEVQNMVITSNSKDDVINLDEIFDEIEEIECSNSKNISNNEDLNSISPFNPKDIENNDITDVLIDNLVNDEIAMKDFELAIDSLSNNDVTNKDTMNNNYNFNIDVDVIAITKENTEICNSNSIENETKIIDLCESFSENSNEVFDQNNNIENEVNSNSITAEIDRTYAHNNKILENYSKISTKLAITKLPPIETVERTKEMKNNNNIAKKKTTAHIIDIIDLISSDDEDEIPLAKFKKLAKTTDCTHISSNSTNAAEKIDTDHCSGYHSSDFEFITEEEARTAGILIRKKRKVVKKTRKRKMFEIERIERLSFEYNSYTDNNNTINEAIRNLLINTISDDKNLNEHEKNVDLELSNSSSEFQELFHDKIAKIDPKDTEGNKALDVNSTMTIDNAILQCTRQNQPVKPNLDAEILNECIETRHLILKLYPEENRKRQIYDRKRRRRL